VRNPHAGQPFTTPDEEIAEALLDVSIPTLMLSLVHMSGDAELIRGPLKPAGLFLNEVQGYMSEEDKASVRKIALDIITDYRDRGCPEPDPVNAELLHEMMQWLVCEPVPDEYVPMLLEEMELDGRDARSVPPAGNADDFPVVVIGCGESGLLAGIRLKEAGIPFTIVEKNAGPGGTWWENRYPGARVDVGSHFYCYSFEPADHWTEYFSQHPELREYFDRVMRKRGIDLDGRRSKHLSEFSRRRFDYVISLCDRVREVCPEFPGGPELIHWSIPDPAREPGSDEETLPAFERTTAELCTRIDFLIEAIEPTTPTREVTERA
jgi:4-hydroxyacetophenone monooxygenase